VEMDSMLGPLNVRLLNLISKRWSYRCALTRNCRVDNDDSTNVNQFSKFWLSNS